MNYMCGVLLNKVYPLIQISDLSQSFWGNLADAFKLSCEFLTCASAALFIYTWKTLWLCTVIIWLFSLCSFGDDKNCVYFSRYSVIYICRTEPSFPYIHRDLLGRVAGSEVAGFTNTDCKLEDRGASTCSDQESGSHRRGIKDLPPDWAGDLESPWRFLVRVVLDVWQSWNLSCAGKDAPAWTNKSLPNPADFFLPLSFQSGQES